MLGTATGTATVGTGGMRPPATGLAAIAGATLRAGRSVLPAERGRRRRGGGRVSLAAIAGATLRASLFDRPRTVVAGSMEKVEGGAVVVGSRGPSTPSSARAPSDRARRHRTAADSSRSPACRRREGRRGAVAVRVRRRTTTSRTGGSASAVRTGDGSRCATSLSPARPVACRTARCQDQTGLATYLWSPGGGGSMTAGPPMPTDAVRV